jgi:anti-sigma28 factor (negative regulator of flagellin synthesis)
MNEQQILQNLGYAGWTVVSRAQTGDATVANPDDQYGPKIANPKPEYTWIISDGKGNRQTIKVRQTKAAVAGAPSPGSTDPSQPAQAAQFEVVEAPNATAPRSSATPKPAKGQRFLDIQGDRALLKEYVDDAGTVSVIDVQALPEGAGKAQTITTKDAVYSWDGKPGSQPQKLLDLPRDRQTHVMGGGANDRFTVVIDEQTGQQISSTANPNYRAPGSERTPEQVAADTAKAAVATGTVQSDIQAAQSAATKANLEVQELERRLAQLPTDDQARESTQIALQNARTARDKAQYDLEQARKVGSLNLRQQQQNLDVGRLGSQYGLDERIAAIKARIARGELSREEGLQQVRAEQLGTSAFTLSQDERRAQEARRSALLEQRQQDLSDINNQRSSWLSGVSSGLDQFSTMNRDVAPGSDAAGRAFLAYMDLLQNRLGQYQAPPPVVEPEAPSGPSGAHQVTINIGGGGGISTGAPAPSPAPATPVAAPAPNLSNPNTWLAGAPQATAAASPTGYDNPLRPATPADVERIWGTRTSGPQYA